MANEERRKTRFKAATISIIPRKKIWIKRNENEREKMRGGKAEQACRPNKHSIELEWAKEYNKLFRIENFLFLWRTIALWAYIPFELKCTIQVTNIVYRKWANHFNHAIWSRIHWLHTIQFKVDAYSSTLHVNWYF